MYVCICIICVCMSVCIFQMCVFLYLPALGVLEKVLTKKENENKLVCELI